MPAWSHSSLTKFETCPRQYYLVRVAKTAKDTQGEAALWGDRVHKALEARVKNKTPLPAGMDQYEPIAAAFDTPKGQVFTETQIALTRNLSKTGWFAKDAWVRGIVDVGVDAGEIVLAADYKGLPLGTKLPTPQGWTTMGEVRHGDTLFDVDGNPCRVIGKSEVKHLRCYEITFDDTSKVVCDEEHIWRTNNGDLSVLEIANTLRKYGRRHHHVVVAKPIQCREAKLPIDPYVLGAWLGDGKHSSSEISKPDEELWDNIKAAGYEVGPDTSTNGCRTATVLGIRKHLRALDLLGNKHVPGIYLRGSISQRVALLQGLMDTDGSFNPLRKQAIFTTCDKRLSDAVVELLCSLGQRPLQSVTAQKGFGLEVTAYPVSFAIVGDLQPFRLSRKANLVTTSASARSWRRLIMEVREVTSVPTQCIKVDSPTSTFLCTEKMVPTHNTGKVKPDNDQLKLFAGLIMGAKPWVQKVRTLFIWLKDNTTTKKTFSRDELPDIWGEYIVRSERLQHAYNQNKWPPKPSGLCNGWCPASRSQCEFSTKP